MADRYGRPVQYGRECAHKSWAQGDLTSLADYMNLNQHFSMEEYKTISGAWEKSAIANSAEPKQ
jgi:hypothetical protein